LRYAALFKLAKLKLGQPDIIFISSSRAGAARSQMFYPYSFYNMSFTAWTLDQMVEIFERATRNAAPRVVLLELDYFLFTDAWVGGDADKAMIFHWLPGYLCSSAVDMIRSAFRHPNRVLSYALGPSISRDASDAIRRGVSIRRLIRLFVRASAGFCHPEHER